MPQSKVHHKLLRATQVIIALVREKESLLKESHWLKAELTELHQQLANRNATNVQGPMQSCATPTTLPPSGGSAQPTSSPWQHQPSHPVVNAEVLVGAPPTTSTAPLTIPGSTRVDVPSNISGGGGPPHVVPSPHPYAPSLPPPTSHSSPIPPSHLNESSDFEKQHNHLERLLNHLENNDDSHAPSSVGWSPPSHHAVIHDAPPIREKDRVGVVSSQGKTLSQKESVGVAPCQEEEGMGVQGTGMRRLPKPATITTTKGPVKAQGRKLVQNKPLKIRNYNDRS